MLQISKQAVKGHYYIYIDDEVAAYIRSPATYEQITKLIEGKSPETIDIEIVDRIEVQDKVMSWEKEK